MNKSNILKISKGSIWQIKDTIRANLYSKKILYVSDNIVDALYGAVVKQQLDELGKTKEILVDYNSISYAMSIAEYIIAADIDCIVGLGGGRVLDVCKYASYVAKIPFVSVPTTIANDGISSPVAVLKKKDDRPKSLGCAVPHILILDTGIIMKSPHDLIRAGIGDTISNYMALKDWELACGRKTDEMNGYAYLMSKTSLDVLMKTQYNNICEEFIEVLSNSLVLSGIAMDFAGSSRPVSGSEHLFSHALDYYGDQKNLHGIQVALGTIAMLKIIGEEYESLLNYLKRFDVKINPQHLNIDEETFILCMQNAKGMRAKRYTYLNEVELERKKLSKVYNELREEL